MVTIPNDPLFPTQWGLFRINAPGGWDFVRGLGPRVTIAVLDTGVVPHEDLPIGYKLLPNGVSFVPGVNAFTDNTGTGHGTLIAGNAAAATNNLLGIAGTSFNAANILSIKVTDVAHDQVAPDIIASAINAAVRLGARVINMSITQAPPFRYTFVPAVQRAIDRAWRAGCVLTAMAGNDGIGRVAYPAAYNRVIAVSGTTQQDTLIGISNFGPQIDVAAPGENIVGLEEGDGYGGGNTGTSVATSFVSGLAAMLFAVNPRLTNADVERIIEATAEQPGRIGRTTGRRLSSGLSTGRLRRRPPRWNQRFGFGIINVVRAMRIAARRRRRR